MDDYYSYKPTVRLERPVLLAALPGIDVGKTARVINMLTGVPLLWLDRRASHLLGRSVEIAPRQERIAAERALLLQFLQRTPPVIAASHLTLLDPGCRDLLSDVRGVHLAQSVSASLDAIREQSAGDPRAFHALREGRTFDADALRPGLEDLEAELLRLPEQVPVEGRPPLDLGRALLERLGIVPTVT
jgi:hypothetical protein